MTREETEAAIMEKLREIREIALAYSPKDEYLSLFFLGDHLSISNGDSTAKMPLGCWMKLSDGKLFRA